MPPEAVNSLLICSSSRSRRRSRAVGVRLIHLWNQDCEISRARQAIACGMPY